MGKTSQKLAYLNETKRLMRRRINSLGGSITLETKFRDYLNWLDGLYNAANSPVEFEILGETKLEAVNTSTNILPLYNDEIVTDGMTVTVSDGGKITINGTAERDVWIKITNGIEAVYTQPVTWRTGLDFDDPYGWVTETTIDLDGETDTYIQYCQGTGDTPTNEGSTSGLYLVYKYPNNSYSYDNQTFNSFISRNYQEKEVEATGKKTISKVNCIYLAFNQGISVNEHFYLQIAKTQETTWTPNYDAAPPSPDNPKTIVNSSGTITYTASDGTEFPVTLEADEGYTFEMCGSLNPNGKSDRIYCKNGKFYQEINITSTTFDGNGETWILNTGEESYCGDIDSDEFKGMYAVSNYFENVANPNITNSTTADTYLKDMQFAVQKDSDFFYLKYNAVQTQETESLDYGQMTTTQLQNWLSTHNVIIQYENRDCVSFEILSSEASTLYGQLQAILDHEAQLQINKKIMGEE